MDSFKRCHPAASFFKQAVSVLLLGVGCLAGAWCAADPYGAWDGLLTPASSSPFSAISPFEAEYRFGWEGVGAGGAMVRVFAKEGGRRQIAVKGGPNALIRKLWNYEANYLGESGGNGEVPSWFHMDEGIPKGDLCSDAYFRNGNVIACHRFIGENKPWESTDLPAIRDLFSAMLFVRSQPLHDGEKLRLTVFPDQSPYLVDLTVVGRDSITVMGKKIRAIRFTIRIQTIETHGEHKGRLAPHKKFRSGRVWMSDDERRLPLRAEVDVFVGRVFAEIVRITQPL